ncbi:MAG: rod shape-determining protein, partial [Chloroflexia bacterium]
MPSHIKPHFGLRGRDLGIDLGAVNILVYAHGKGVVVSEPTALAVDSATGEVLAIGAEARALAARTPDIVVLRTLVDGSTLVVLPNST